MQIGFVCNHVLCLNTVYSAHSWFLNVVPSIQYPSLILSSTDYKHFILASEKWICRLSPESLKLRTVREGTGGAGSGWPIVVASISPSLHLFPWSLGCHRCTKDVHLPCQLYFFFFLICQSTNDWRETGVRPSVIVDWYLPTGLKMDESGWGNS